MDIQPMPLSDPAKAIEKATEVLTRPMILPAGSEVTESMIKLPDGALPGDVPPRGMDDRGIIHQRQCHMRSLADCQNEPHCSEAGECVLFLAIGSVRERKASEAGQVEALRAGYREIRELTGATQCRPWTALSLIDQIARKALA